ncbi:hypothetical protein H257_04183 [Aphanomyces astaci]|uniref:Uncharacterized protein n=1 Tax=Aphanomyces astaci TaxID=112090 RepID=W4GUP9_APHAT|nr:hypothetical protein H257_04183 [Aphanomyces astaci]ETV83460.1 hypothetical protein H257_04183 [Aphanomyces astaci]|eukprot:XP_009826890.1 hypothetical protein H257_04183 [Aphanomyces astaci]
MAKKGKQAKQHGTVDSSLAKLKMGNTATSPTAAADSKSTPGGSPVKAKQGKSASYPTTPISTSKSTFITSSSPSTQDDPHAVHAGTSSPHDDNDDDDVAGDGKVVTLVPKIERRLSTRPEVKDLDDQDILHSLTIAPMIQSTAKQLQRQLSADHVSSLLTKRPSFVDLTDQGIVSDKIAPALQATSDALRRSITADRLTHHIARRPSLQDLADQHVVDDGTPSLAPSLAAMAKKLERTMVQNQVGQLLETRPGLHDLVSQQIVTDGPEVANALQGPRQSLVRQLKADELSRKLKSRKSFDQLFTGPSNALKSNPTKNVSSKQQQKPALSNAQRRARYTVALKAASRIAADKLISAAEKGRLKDLILADDSRVSMAIALYENDRDVEEMLDTLYRIAKSTSRGSM